MTQEEIEDYANRVKKMLKKEPAYIGWGYFYFQSVYKQEETNLCETKKNLQHLKKLKFRF